ncbi:MAG: hypothetical protein ACRYFS_11280 [Janthinobacterium lividum]
MTLTLAPETGVRLLAVAAQKGIAPEEVIDLLLGQDIGETELPNQVSDILLVQDTPEQARLRDVFAQLQIKALALVPEPYKPNPDQAEEERLFGEIITEKYRKQGFNLP